MFAAHQTQTGHQSQPSCQPVDLCEMWTMMASTVCTEHRSNVVPPDDATSAVRLRNKQSYLDQRLQRLQSSSEVHIEFFKLGN